MNGHCGMGLGPKRSKPVPHGRPPQTVPRGHAAELAPHLPGAGLRQTPFPLRMGQSGRVWAGRTPARSVGSDCTCFLGPDNLCSTSQALDMGVASMAATMHFCVRGLFFTRLFPGMAGHEVPIFEVQSWNLNCTWRVNNNNNSSSLPIEERSHRCYM